MNWCKRIGFSLFLPALLLQSCSTVTHLSRSNSTAEPSVESMPWVVRQERLNQFKAWQLSGKLAFQTAREANSANINWQENRRHYAISLFGPLGTPGPKLIGKPGQITLITPQGKIFQNKSPEALLTQFSGIQLPVSNLYYWVRGLPAPNTPHHDAFDSSHRLTQLSQQAWHIQFLHYTQVGALELPDKITLVSPDLKIKIFISDWKRL